MRGGLKIPVFTLIFIIYELLTSSIANAGESSGFHHNSSSNQLFKIPRIYFTQKKDTLVHLAEVLYSSKTKWQAIRDNNPELSQLGPQDRIGKRVRVHYLAPEIGSTYQVRSRDWLSKISRWKYGTLRCWKNIYNENRAILKNFNVIEPGKVLSLSPTCDPNPMRTLSSVGPENAPRPSTKKLKEPDKRDDNTMKTQDSVSLILPKKTVRSDVITLTPRYQLTELAGIDSQTGLRADLYATGNWGLDLGWEHDFKNSSWQSTLSGGTTLYSFNQPLYGASLSAPNKTTWKFQIEARDQLSSKVTLLLSGGFSEDLGISGLNTSTLSLDGVTIPKVGAGLHIHLLKEGTLSLGLIPTGKLLLPSVSANYSSRFGNEEAIVLSLKKDYDTTLWKLELGASRQDYTTSFSDNSQNNLFLSLTLGFDAHRRTVPSDSNGGSP